MRSKSQHEEPTVAAHAALLLCELKQDARAGRAVDRLAEKGSGKQQHSNCRARRWGARARAPCGLEQPLAVRCDDNAPGAAPQHFRAPVGSPRRRREVAQGEQGAHGQFTQGQQGQISRILLVTLTLNPPTLEGSKEEDDREPD